MKKIGCNTANSLLAEGFLYCDVSIISFTINLFFYFFFQVFDKNRDGYIDEEELRLTMKDLGMSLADDDIEAMMKKAGCKIPGRIYYEGLFCSDVIKLPLSSRPLGTTFTHRPVL